MESEEKKIFSLYQLLESVERMVSKHYINQYWIRAEMIKLNRYQEQHCYPEFVEKKGNEIIADIRGIIWSSTFDTINQRFKTVVGEPLKDNMKVVMLVKLDYTPKRGLMLQILDIDPTFTLGDMMLEKSHVLAGLETEGLMRKNKQLPAFLLPRRIAIISVVSSKGYQDFNNVLSTFSEHYRPYCMLFTAALQGDKAVDSMINAFQTIKKNHQLFDVVIILRGGGSEVGLTCYDDYRLAAEIANFPIPVLTGIGHSSNETIAEMVAWKNLITPTDTAYHIINYFKTAEKEIQVLAQKTVTCALNYLNEKSNKVQQCTTSLQWKTQKQIKLNKVALENQQFRLNFCINLLISSQKNTLNLTAHQFQKLALYFLQKKEHQLEMTSLRITITNPQQLLRQGYSLTRKEGKIVQSIHDLHSGDRIITEIHDGQIESIVQ
ncbi:MAG: exodeoxyribonuclease VII large subunit [Bacteroidales bacterium]|nr:exodeoxyribonuclease VII large subunit [Bacteroidales bacterium]